MTRSGPADPQGDFFHGRIGVLVPSFDRRYLIAAHRYLSGRAFSKEEADAFMAPAEPVGIPYSSASFEWEQARRSIPGVTVISYLNPSESKKTGTSFFSFPNCLDNAFVAATETLVDLVKRWGSDSLKVREWLAAQDKVFSNCSADTPAIPDEPTAGMDALLAAHREYQIAVAYFYAGDWEAARQGFERVGHDKDSPWAGIAPYLIARVSLREGMIDERPAALEDAARRFQAIVNDPKQDRWHSASEDLLDFTDFRIHAADRLAKYASELDGQSATKDLSQHLGDFNFLFAHVDDKTKVAASSDLADWLLTFQPVAYKPRGTLGSHAVERWRNSKASAWLIAALFYASDDADIIELVNAARATTPDDLSYESVVYYGIGAEIRRGHRAAARSWADHALSGQLLLSTRNRILYERLRLARDWTEFLRFAPREPEPKVSFFDSDEVPEAGQWAKAGPLFDADATQALNSHIPLALLLDASRSRRLSRHLQMQIAQAGFVRSIVLDRLSEARDFMRRMVELSPAVAEEGREFLTAPDDATAHFAAILLLLRISGLQGVLWPGEWNSPDDLPRAGYVGSSLRWGFEKSVQSQTYVSALSLPLDLGFLSASQREQADLEWKTLSQKAGCSATYVETEALRWAIQHPDDKRVPEALHRLVITTFRGCRDSRDGSLGRRSHGAFVLLKQRYPDSPWTKKTKYWYK
jgi:hypothetical protein